MYESFYGLREKPFNLLPDPDYMYMSHGHENAYAHLEYAIAENKGFVVVTGEIGSGKTTLINYILRKLQHDFQIGIVNQTDVTPNQFLRIVCQEFELNVDALDKTETLEAFNQFLLEQFAAENRVLLIVDEAQNLPPKTLEEIRMLSNLESEKHHLIQIILVGQPELKFKLQRKGLEQFAQRVTVHCHLEGLANDEVTQYIQHRLQVAEAQNPNLFEPEAIDMIHKYSRGIPRVINIICDTALVFGFADERQTIQPDLIETVVRERKDAGIYFHAIEEPGPRTVPGEAEDAVSEAGDNRVQFLERRVRMLENMVNHIDQRLTMMTDKRDERDTTVVELIKMLKQNMESRMRLILKLLQLSQRTLTKDDASEHDVAAQRTSFFSRRKRGA